MPRGWHLLLLGSSLVFSQQWNNNYQAPLNFVPFSPQRSTNNFYPNHQPWTQSQNGVYGYGSQQGVATNAATTTGNGVQMFHDTVVQHEGLVDRRQGVNAGEVEVAPEEERRARIGRSHSSAPPPEQVHEKTPQSSLSMDELKDICPPPTVKYIILRTLKNGMTAAEEAEEVPVTSNQVAQTIASEMVEMMNGSGGGGKREVSPSESREKKKISTTTTAAPDEDEAVDTAEEVVEVDDKCNSETLRKLIVNNIVPGDAGGSKRAIHNAVTPSTQSVDVICSTTGFTYLVTTTDHCEAQTDGVICFAYRTE